MSVHRWSVLLVLAALVGCKGSAAADQGDEGLRPRPQAEAPSPPDPYDVGVVHRTITTESESAQRWFDRGLGLCFGFNHEEAVRCFAEAAAADPGCAMAHWGTAYALGPNYNSPAIDPQTSEKALAALDRAEQLLDAETPAERGLITALRARFSDPDPEQRGALDRAYADAMRTLHQQFPEDAEVAALTAEAIMQLRPWELWSPEGEAAPETPQIRAILEPALERWPRHPALAHLYIHTMEAGPEVARALPAARSLERLSPGLGHLIHMPSHIYVWTGHYDDVIRTNVEAVRADDAFVALRGRDNFFTAYRIHNHHFVAYGGMWSGRKDLALEYARTIPEEISPAMLAAAPDLFDVFHATPYHVQVRFGLWDELLEEPEPAAELVATRAVWRYARGVALASLGRIEEAEAERAAFLAAKDAVPASRMLFNNPVSEILNVADPFLEGELEYRKGNHERAFELLRLAVERDERLNYDEPWGWMEPARHALGALLTEQGRYEEALTEYQRNLERYPENGWALHGMAECLRGLGRHTEAEAVQARFELAWAKADTPIPGSCFCRRAGQP